MAIKNVKTQSGNPIAVFIAVFIIDGIIPSLLKNVLTLKFNTKLKTLCWWPYCKKPQRVNLWRRECYWEAQEIELFKEDGKREMKTPIMNSKDILKPCCSSPDENAGLVEFCKASHLPKFIFCCLFCICFILKILCFIFLIYVFVNVSIKQYSLPTTTTMVLWRSTWDTWCFVFKWFQFSIFLNITLFYRG